MPGGVADLKSCKRRRPTSTRASGQLLCVAAVLVVGSLLSSVLGVFGLRGVLALSSQQGLARAAPAGAEKLREEASFLSRATRVARQSPNRRLILKRRALSFLRGGA